MPDARPEPTPSQARFRFIFRAISYVAALFLHSNLSHLPAVMNISEHQIEFNAISIIFTCFALKRDHLQASAIIYTIDDNISEHQIEFNAISIIFTCFALKRDNLQASAIIYIIISIASCSSAIEPCRTMTSLLPIIRRNVQAA